jgi:hypothetical protein
VQSFSYGHVLSLSVNLESNLDWINISQNVYYWYLIDAIEISGSSCFLKTIKLLHIVWVQLGSGECVLDLINQVLWSCWLHTGKYYILRTLHIKKLRGKRFINYTFYDNLCKIGISRKPDWHSFFHIIGRLADWINDWASKSVWTVSPFGMQGYRDLDYVVNFACWDCNIPFLWVSHVFQLVSCHKVFTCITYVACE